MSTKSLPSNQTVMVIAAILSSVLGIAIVTQYPGRIDAACSLSGCHFQLDGRHGETPLTPDRKDL